MFSPTWTLIFGLLAVATWQIDRRASSPTLARKLYAGQLVLNVAWSLLFFTLHNPLWALVDIVILEAVVVAMIVSYGRIHRPSGLFLAPYALWLGLATAINVWIVLHN